MNSFNRTVVIIAGILLVTLLVILAISLSKSLFNEAYPPIVPDCPDYWEVQYDSNDKARCVNHSGVNLGNTSLEDCGDYTSYFDRHSDEGNCNRYNWAKKCSVNWDGITNSSVDFCN